MKTKIISIAAAAVVGMGIAGAAGTASAGAAPAINADAIRGQTANKLARVHHGYGQYHRRGYRFRCRRLYIRGFHYGNPWAKRAWYRQCSRRGGLNYRCRRWYVAGFKYGNWQARKMWYRYCRPYSLYR